MKKIYILMAMFLSFSVANASEIKAPEMLFPGEQDLKFTTEIGLKPYINGDLTESLLSIKAGWLINRVFKITAGGSFMFGSNRPFSAIEPGNSRDYFAGSAGLELAAVILSDSMIHLDAGVMTGEALLMNITKTGSSRTAYFNASLYAEPKLNVIINIVNWLQIGLGAGYIFVFSDSDFNGFTANCMLGIGIY